MDAKSESPVPSDLGPDHVDLMVGAQPWRYGDLELGNLSKDQDDFTVGSSGSDVSCRLMCLYHANDGDRHRHHNNKGRDHKGEGSSLNECSEIQNCEARRRCYPPPRRRGCSLRGGGGGSTSVSR